MNRQARRAAASKRSRPGDRKPAEQYRVAAGRIALTIDFQGRAPSTISINASALVDVVDSIGELVVGKSYQQVLHLLVAAIRAADGGNVDAWNACLVGFWLAVNHPQAGAEIAGRLSDALALDGCAHLTFHANRDRGIAFALADQFVDLDHAAHLARQSGAATIIATNPSRQRPGGRA
jgi:hypothetical protein